MRPLHHPRKITVTRRFRCRPEGSSLPWAVVFGAAGRVAPKPCALKRAALIPLRTSQAETASARASESR